MEKVAILGPGLLGGSLALALRARGAVSVAVWARRAEAAAAAERLGAADVASNDLRKVVADANIVVLCTPVGAMPSLARELVESLSPDALVTDVGSVKNVVVKQLNEIFAHRGRFIGSHPMAGSEQAGIDAARRDLFQGAACIITPDPSTARSSIEEVTAFWKSVGCNVGTLSPEAHDQVVALISHLPHLVATTLLSTIHDLHPAAFAFAGPGLRDSTRVASGPPEMWAEILDANRDPVRHAVEAMIEKLGQTLKLLDRATPTCDLQAFLTRIKTQRDTIRFPK
jgi:prephenate dehydrogenase